MTPTYFAQNIQTGNSSAQSLVQTNIQGNGSVSTHIEVSANGEKKVLDTNSPGNYKLEVQSNSYNSNVNNPTISPIISLSPTPISSPSPTIIPKTANIHKFSYLSNLIKNIQIFFGNIFNTFKSKNV